MDESLAKLVRHSNWANAQLVDFLLIEKIDDPVVLKLICHIGHGESAWFQRIYAQPVNPDIFRIVPLEELRALFVEHEQFYDEQLRGDLSRELDYVRFNGDACRSSVEEILLHLATHGFHHRGQIATLLSKRGTKMPNLDFISFSRTLPR